MSRAEHPKTGTGGGQQQAIADQPWVHYTQSFRKALYHLRDFLENNNALHGRVNVRLEFQKAEDAARFNMGLRRSLEPYQFQPRLLVEGTVTELDGFGVSYGPILTPSYGLR